MLVCFKLDVKLLFHYLWELYMQFEDTVAILASTSSKNVRTALQLPHGDHNNFLLTLVKSVDSKDKITKGFLQ